MIHRRALRGSPPLFIALFSATVAYAGPAPDTAPGAPAAPATAATPGESTPTSAPPPAKARGPSLSLSQAEELTLAHQPALAVAAGQVEASQGRVEEARAGYLPQIAVTGTYQRTTGNFAPRPGGLPSAVTAASWNASTYNYFNFGVAGSQLIYDFGQTSDRWRAAAANRDAADAGRLTARAQALLAVRRAYLQARAQVDLVAVADEAYENQSRHLVQTQGFVRAGMRPEIDLARARTDLANAKVQLVNAQNGLAIAMATLNQTMGLAADRSYDLADAGLPPRARARWTGS